jgi:hypothetical protein
MKRRQNNETIFENAKEPHPNNTEVGNIIYYKRITTGSHQEPGAKFIEFLKA